MWDLASASPLRSVLFFQLGIPGWSSVIFSKFSLCLPRRHLAVCTIYTRGEYRIARSSSLTLQHDRLFVSSHTCINVEATAP